MALLGFSALALALLASLAPVAASLLIIGVVAMTAKRVGIATSLVAMSLTALFSWMNIGKTVSGDWRWYTYHYSLLQERELSQYLGQTIAGIPVEATEPVYYTLAWALSNLTHGDQRILSITITVLVYALIAIASYRVARAVAPGNRAAVPAATAVAMLAGVTFTLTTQLVRQEIALALVVLGTSFLLAPPASQRYAILAFSLAGLTHNSAVIPIAAVLAARLVLAPRGVVHLSRLPVLAILFYAGGRAYVYISPPAYRTADDGAISIAVYALDAALLTTFVLTRKSFDTIPSFAATVFGAILLFTLFLSAIWDLAIPLLRMYFYMEGFRVILVAALAANLLRSRYRAVLLPLTLLAGLLYFELRIQVSDFVYDGTLTGHILRGPFT